MWKSTDGGATWKPTFDSQTSQAIGALAVAQTNPDIVWAGTGEAWAVRDMDMMGDGIYKSTDAGETWTNMGLVETGRIGTIVIHPTNPEIVLACALGRATGPQKERGVFRTEDGGKTWQQVLFVDENTGCSGLQMSQQDPNDRPRRHVGDRDADARPAQRRHGQRHLPLERRRQDVHEDHAPRPAALALRQDGRRDRAVERQRGCTR